jgi:DNA-binding NarL/FixJ family response regulator
LLIVDDMPHVREELRRLLELTNQVQVVGEAVYGQEALHRAEALRPGVVLMDLEMPKLDGWEALRHIKQRSLVKWIVAWSIHDDARSIKRAREAGADIFVPKGTDLKALINAITAQEE